MGIIQRQPIALLPGESTWQDVEAWPRGPHLGYGLRYRLSPGAWRIHHPALIRARGIGSAAIDEPWSGNGDEWRSPLTGEFHFSMDPGDQSFGMPSVVTAWNGSTFVTLGVLSEDEARAAFVWGQDATGPYIETRLRFAGCPDEGHYPGNLEALFEHVGSFESLPEALESYFEALAETLPTVPPRQELFWGSWNDGHFRDIDQARVLSTADWLKDHAPNVRWIQIDDGWAPVVPGREMSTLDRFYSNELEDFARFPGGMRGLSQAIRAAGFRPMLWLTMAVHEASSLVAERPDWLLQGCRLHFMPELRFLDFSLPDVRDFAESAFEKAFDDWGFEGCKLDFWSMGFDQPDVRWGRPGATSPQEMDWLLSRLRQFVRPDGLLLHCIDLPFGNPVRARAFDQFRYYADSEGSCENLDMMREQAVWAAALVTLYRVQRWWVPDGDGLGVFPHFALPENRYRLWCAFLLGSGTLTEVAGWLGAEGDPERARLLATVLPWARLGASVSLPGYGFDRGRLTAPHVWVRHDAEDTVLVALTNWNPISEQHVLGPEMVGWPPGTFEPLEIEVAPEDGRAIIFRAGSAPEPLL